MRAEAEGAWSSLRERETERSPSGLFALELRLSCRRCA